jgi:hypothetical protein
MWQTIKANIRCRNVGVVALTGNSIGAPHSIIIGNLEINWTSISIPLNSGGILLPRLIKPRVFEGR